MKTKVLMLAAALLSQSTYALDIGKEFQNLTKELQKRDIVKVGPRVFSHDSPQDKRPTAGEFWIGVVGDSSATGAAASPDFQATWLSLLGHLGSALGVVDLPQYNTGLPAPMRVMYTEAEFNEEDGIGEALQLNAESDLAQKIDTEQYSFGYAVAQKLGVPAEKLVLTGQDGTRVSHLSRQFNRFLSVGTGSLPPLVLVSFIANDICHPANFTNPVGAFEEQYRARLRYELAQVAKLPADPKGTRIVFLAPLDIANVLTNPALLAQTVPFEASKNMTCGQIRAGETGGGDLEKAMADTLVGECRGVLDMDSDPAAKLAQLKALQEAQARVIQEALQEFNTHANNVRADYAASTKTIEFKTGDLANDCFHPSKAGAERIADQLVNNELKR